MSHKKVVVEDIQNGMTKCADIRKIEKNRIGNEMRPHICDNNLNYMSKVNELVILFQHFIYFEID